MAVELWGPKNVPAENLTPKPSECSYQNTFYCHDLLGAKIEVSEYLATHPTSTQEEAIRGLYVNADLQSHTQTALNVINQLAIIGASPLDVAKVTIHETSNNIIQSSLQYAWQGKPHLFYKIYWNNESGFDLTKPHQESEKQAVEAAEREYDVVYNRVREAGFGAYLQHSFFLPEDLMREIDSRNKYPTQKELKEIHDGMDYWNGRFIGCYLNTLADQEVNPLILEQTAFSLLSSSIKQFTDSFGEFIDKYDPRLKDSDSLFFYIGRFYALIRQWNIISNSYKAKESMDFPLIAPTEDAVIDLIDELRSQGVQPTVYPI
jgi:hypothetical protein